MSYYAIEGEPQHEQKTATEEIGFSELDREQKHAYARLVQDGAYYLYNSILTLEDCSAIRALEDDEEPTDSLDERFKNDVEAYYRCKVGEEVDAGE